MKNSTNAQTDSLSEINTDKQRDINSEKNCISALILRSTVASLCLYCRASLGAIGSAENYIKVSERKYNININWYYLVKNSFR